MSRSEYVASLAIQEPAISGAWATPAPARKRPAKGFLARLLGILK